MSNVLNGNFAFKKNLDKFDYDQYLAEIFKDIQIGKERAGYNGEEDLKCVFSVDAKEWKRWQKQDLLGGLYNRDLSNYLSRRGILKHYAEPSVNDRSRAKNGRKMIAVYFRLK